MCTVDYKPLLADVHTVAPLRGDETLGHGQYLYYHYGCDGVDDRGWGCGYRTLQTLCSWAQISDSLKSKCSSVPSIKEIQIALVEMNDKPAEFIDSKQWIGSVEISFCLDFFYHVPCKILHVPKGSEMRTFLFELAHHFNIVGSPVMLGGESDNTSRAVMGVRLEDPALLIVDPHFYGNKPTIELLLHKGFIRWLPISDLHTDTFYNFCIPCPSL